MTFTKLTTADEVLAGVDLTGQTMIVTGASGGIEAETARVLAAPGASVVLAARDRAKAERIASGIEEIAPTAVVRILPLDLSSLASVRSFEQTADGFELQFGTNHLGHFVLANRLVQALVAAAPSRVVVLSSGAHRWSDVDLNDSSFTTTPYDKHVAYARGKTANVLFAVALDRRWRQLGVRAFAVHPGAIHTDLGRALTDEDRSQIDEMAKKGGTTWKTVEQGAATSVWARNQRRARRTGRRVPRGLRCRRDHGRQDQQRCPIVPLDERRGDELWDLSERIGERFPS